TLTALNLPLLWLSHRLWGGRVGVRTVFGTLMLSLWVGVFASLHLPAVTHNTLLAAIYGGILSGTGLGLVFRSRGTTGGTDVLARFLSHVLPISMGQGLLAVDFVIISAYGLVFDPQAALYSLIALFLSTRAVDLVQEGIAYARAFTIISDRPDEIARAILSEMGRGLTRWAGEGAYTGQHKTILFVLVSRPEVTRLKELVYRVDPRAFVVVGTVHEVIGEGFRSPPAEE
ncbi:MAG: YitT family protein, partial [Firmicutes bacterium]|nr:YitT family protein [Bacillota bacterium]